MDKEDESKRTEAKLKQELTEAKIEIHNLMPNPKSRIKYSINTVRDNLKLTNVFIDVCHKIAFIFSNWEFFLTKCNYMGKTITNRA